MLRPLLPAVLAATLAAVSPASQVWIVDAAGGGDFLDLQPAIDFAAEGDTLMVKSGAYGDAVIFAKALRVVGAPAQAKPQIDGLSVRGLGANQFVLLSGLSLLGAFEEGLSVKNSAGRVWVEDSVLVGHDGEGALSAPDFHPTGFAGARVSNSSDVAFMRCELRGGNSAPSYFWPTLIHGEGANGLELVDAERVVVAGCKLVGTDGGDATSDQAAIGGGQGGSGADLVRSDLVILDSQLIGGSGGNSGESFEPPLFWECADGANAGDGVHVSEGPVLVEYGDLTFTTGTPGLPFSSFGSCNPGVPGQLLKGFGSTFVDLGAVAYGLEMQTIVAQGGTNLVQLEGPTNSLGFLLVSGAPASFAAAPVQGLVLVAPSAGPIIGVGALPTSKVFAVPLTAPVGGATWLYTQLVGFDLSTSRFTCGQAHAFAVLAPGL